jgi:hypothetical protein
MRTIMLQIAAIILAALFLYALAGNRSNEGQIQPYINLHGQVAL